MARKKTVFQSIREDQLEDPPDRPVRPDREGNREERDALSDLALQMAALPTERRKKLPIDGELAEIVELLNRVLRGSGRKRLIRRAVKLLRVEDVEALQREVSGEGAYDDRLHALERWRTRILEEGDPAIHDFVHQHEGADRVALRNLARQAKGESPAAVKARKRLFQTLKTATPRPAGEE